MKAPKIRRRTGISGLALALLAMPLCNSVVVHGQQAATPVEHTAAPAQTPQKSNSATASYSSSLASIDAPTPTETASIAPAQDNGQTQNPPSTSATENQKAPEKPVGAAAAPGESAAGVTAARPAGAVIAPAKQRRVRAILIRVGLLVGAGVALGTVMALSHATPSQPQ